MSVAPPLPADRELLAQLVLIGVQAREHPAGEFGLAWTMLLACARQLALYPQELEVLMATAFERRATAHFLAVRLHAKSPAVETVLERLRVAGAVRTSVLDHRWELTADGAAWLALWLGDPVALRAVAWLLAHKVLPPTPARRPKRS